MMRLVFAGSITIGIMLFASLPAIAQDVRWTGPAGNFPPGSFFDAGNWNENRIPGAADRVLFGWDPGFIPSTPQRVVFGDFRSSLLGAVTPGGVATISQLEIQGGNFHFDLNAYNVLGGASGGLTLTSQSGYSLAVGTTAVETTGLPGSPRLTVSGNGTLATREARIGIGLGSPPGSNGRMTVTGPGTRWNVGSLAQDNDSVGVAGMGSELEILNGATVEVTRGVAVLNQSHALIDGSGTTVTAGGRIIVESGAGVVISNGASASTTGTFTTYNDGGLVTIGGIAGTNSRLTVTGAGTTLTAAGQINISPNRFGNSQGDGTFLISDGAVVSSKKNTSATGSSGIVGGAVGTTASATITGDGSSWTQDGGMSVGFVGNGTLLVEDGGMLRSVDGFVGRSAGSTGHATVTGAGSLWQVDETLVIGGTRNAAGGVGSLTVADGGRVTVGERLELWDAGTITLDDASILVGTPQSATPVETIHVGLGGVLAGTGTIRGDVFLDGGILRPGHSPGRLAIDGGLILGANGLLEMEIGGLVAGSQYDQLTVAGDGSFNGLLRISFIDGFAPSPGDSFDLITIAGLATGHFSSIEFLGVGPGYQFTTGFVGDTFRLGVMAVPEPASWMMYAIGLGGFAIVAARRKKGRAAL